MSLPTPVLDDRKFQQIVDEVRKRIPLYCPEWTDHNLSDPGVTMIELFAWMVELLLYRLNRVPELHYIKFMEFLGYQRRTPSAARTRVTFWLTKALTEQDDRDNRDVLIAQRTEVATTQTETKAPIVFTTDENFSIRAPILQAIVRESRQEGRRALQLNEFLQLREGLRGLAMFSNPPQADEAVYFGFDNPKRDLSYHILSLLLDFEPKSGVGADPNHPPYVWEVYTDEESWQELVRTEVVDRQHQTLTVMGEVEKDSTRALNVRGEVLLILPELGKTRLTGEATPLHWVRVRIKRPTALGDDQEIRSYVDTPYLRRIIQVAAAGASVSAFHGRQVAQEALGESSGEPGQRFVLDGKPVLLPLIEGEAIRVKVNEEDDDQEEELWRYCDHFADSRAESRHFTLDSLSGEVRFGPTVRQPNGEMIQYGKTPPRGARLRFEAYRYGGGIAGNVARKELNVLKSSIPYIDRVENRLPAVGGVDGQGVDAAQLEVQRLIRTRRLAITPDDYEARVLEQFTGRIARVQCIPLTTGLKAAIRLYLLPTLPTTHDGYLPNGVLPVTESLRQEVDHFLEQIRMLTVPARSETVAYQRLRVVVKVRKKAGVSINKAKSLINQRLQDLLHPVTGGFYGQGWPFGATITAAALQQAIAQLSVVAAVEALELQKVEPAAEDKHPDQYTVQDISTIQGGSLTLSEGQMVVAGRHEVAILDA